MADSEWTWIHRVAAIAFVVAGVLFIVGTPFAIQARPVVATASDILAFVAQNPLPLTVASLSFGVVDLLLVPAVLALYVVLRRTNKPVVAVATAWFGLAIAFDLASRAASLSLLGLSVGFDAATDNFGRAAYAAAAEGLLGMQRWAGSLVYFLWGFYAVLVGWVMLRSPFGRPIGYIGMGSGFLGMIGCWFFITEFLGANRIALGAVLYLAIILWAAWYFLIATKLYRREAVEAAGRS
ncbi:MAG: DUF4386 family protein [Thermoplasmata archaeon]